MRYITKGYNMYTSLKHPMEHLRDLIKNDPVKMCELYKNEGCSHVDGMLCDYPECDMLKEYTNEQRN